MTGFPAVRLVELEDVDFDWLLSGVPARHDGLVLPPGGVDDPETIEHVRMLTKRLNDCGLGNSWMAVAGFEVVGMIGHKSAPSNGLVEIGYGIAAGRRGRGYATQAVAAVVAAARADPALRGVAADTAVANVASQRVLIKNGFARRGERIDPLDGVLLRWQIEV